MRGHESIRDGIWKLSEPVCPRPSILRNPPSNHADFGRCDVPRCRNGDADTSRRRHRRACFGPPRYGYPGPTGSTVRAPTGAWTALVAGSTGR